MAIIDSAQGDGSIEPTAASPAEDTNVFFNLAADLKAKLDAVTLTGGLFQFDRGLDLADYSISNASSIEMQGDSPAVYFRETDAALDEKSWQFVASGGRLYVRTLTDGLAFGSNLLDFDRTAEAGAGITCHTHLKLGSYLDGQNNPLLNVNRIAGHSSSALRVTPYTGQSLILEQPDGTDALVIGASGLALGVDIDMGGFGIENCDALEVEHSGTARIRLRNSSASADEKLWSLDGTITGDFRVGTLTDAGGGGNDLLSASRSGTTVTGLAIAADVDLGGNSLSNVGALELQASSDPEIVLVDDSEAANNKAWGIISAAGVLAFAAYTDGGAYSNAAFQLERTDTTADLLKMFATFDANTNPAINVGYLGLVDGVTAPSSVSGDAYIYVDSADGDLKVIFGDGHVATIATDS